MGYIRKLDDNVDIQTFPGAKFELTGDVPAPQCSEAKIEHPDGRTDVGEKYLQASGLHFAGYDLTGKALHIISPPLVAGDYVITNNSDFKVWTPDFMAGEAFPVDYYISDGGALILTRNVPSFAQFIHDAGYAYTIKGGKLYTNMPSGQLKDACTILFDPIT